MRSFKIISVFISCMLFVFLSYQALYAGSDTLKGNGRAEKFLEAVKAYEKGDYASSARGFEDIANNNKVISSGLFYNIGNSYLKQGNNGLAMLWYERARQLSPGDPDLDFNISFLKKRLEDDFEIKNSIMSGEIFFLTEMMSESLVIKITLVSNMVFWTLLIFYYFLRKNVFKPFMAIAGLILFIFSSNAFYGFFEKTILKKAIIIPSEVAVKSGTSDKAPDLFKLHAGTKVIVEDAQSGYVKISDGDEKRGWVKAGDALQIAFR